MVKVAFLMVQGPFLVVIQKTLSSLGLNSAVLKTITRRFFISFSCLSWKYMTLMVKPMFVIHLSASGFLNHRGLLGVEK